MLLLSDRTGKVLIPGPAAGGSFEVNASAGLAEKAAVLDHHVAARHHKSCVSLYFEAFEHGIIDSHVMRFGADEVAGLGVPNDDVGVATRREGAFPRLE